MPEVTLPPVPRAFVAAGVAAFVLLAVVGVRVVAPLGPGGQRDVSALPAVDAVLNGTAAALLVAGFVAIRRRNVTAHRASMLAAFGVSALFLVSYLTYHANAGPRPFPGHGPVRAVYFGLLVTHVVLAAAIVPLTIVTIARALRGRFAQHVRIARWTLPLWLYVSVTGVLIYLMLYRLY